ncbi:hypothetical protein N0V82_000712 [Gnomoniopsis sp. IMI 355080]|nr:hypothetical protein N0V82_000712 [Gnomoniopsis sp. IMI 355080]
MNKVPQVVTQLSRTAPQSLSTTGAALVDSRRTFQSQQTTPAVVEQSKYHHGWDQWHPQTAHEIEVLRTQAADMARSDSGSLRPVERRLG